MGLLFAAVHLGMPEQTDWQQQQEIPEEKIELLLLLRTCSTSWSNKECVTLSLSIAIPNLNFGLRVGSSQFDSSCFSDRNYNLGLKVTTSVAVTATLPPHPFLPPSHCIYQTAAQQFFFLALPRELLLINSNHDRVAPRSCHCLSVFIMQPLRCHLFVYFWRRRCG